MENTLFDPENRYSPRQRVGSMDSEPNIHSNSNPEGTNINNNGLDSNAPGYGSSLSKSEAKDHGQRLSPLEFSSNVLSGRTTAGEGQGYSNLSSGLVSESDLGFDATPMAPLPYKQFLPHRHQSIQSSPPSQPILIDPSVLDSIISSLPQDSLESFPTSTSIPMSFPSTPTPHPRQRTHNPFFPATTTSTQLQNIRESIYIPNFHHSTIAADQNESHITYPSMGFEMEMSDRALGSDNKDQYSDSNGGGSRAIGLDWQGLLWDAALREGLTPNALGGEIEKNNDDAAGGHGTSNHVQEIQRSLPATVPPPTTSTSSMIGNPLTDNVASRRYEGRELCGPELGSIPGPFITGFLMDSVPRSVEREMQTESLRCGEEMRVGMGGGIISSEELSQIEKTNRLSGMGEFRQEIGGIDESGLCRYYDKVKVEAREGWNANPKAYLPIPSSESPPQGKKQPSRSLSKSSRKFKDVTSNGETAARKREIHVDEYMERRKAQNRAAQKRLRNKKNSQLQFLEERKEELEKEMCETRAFITNLRRENESLLANDPFLRRRFSDGYFVNEIPVTTELYNDFDCQGASPYGLNLIAPGYPAWMVPKLDESNALSGT